MKGLLRSFAGGEIAPEMFGRLDLGKYQTGLQLCRNFRTLAHGPATRRPGFYYGNEVFNSDERVRLIPFTYSATDAVVIELGDLTMRFHSAAGTQLEAAKAIVSVTQANPGVFEVTGHAYTVGQWVFVTSAAGMTSINGQFYVVASVPDANHVTLKYIGAASAIDTSALPAYTGSGTVSRVYTVTTPWAADDLDTLTYSQDADVLTITSTVYEAQDVRRVAAANWTITPVDFTPTLAPPTSVTGTPTTDAATTNAVLHHYVVTSVADDGVTESVASADATANNNLTQFSNYNTIDWVVEPDAARYYVYRKRGGAYGFIGQTTEDTFIDDNIVPDLTRTPPENFSSLNTAAGDYPGTVTHFEQRRWFGGTANEPQKVWATRNGTDSNLTSSVPTRDDDALEFRIKAQQQNAIRHLVPLVDLVALTVGSEFRIFADPGPAITPTSLSTKPQSFTGAALVQPALTQGSALYVQAQGSRVRELTFDPSGLGVYKSVDVSLFAPHLFNSHQVSELAYTRAPDQTLWGIREDGVLLGLTYVPEQQVYGWHQHETDGVFESCAVIPEGGEDVLYVVVRRTFGGRARRYIERMKSRFFADQDHAFYVDSGLTYDGAPTTTVTGLRHLEGLEVQILADGAVHPPQTVTNGSITLEDGETASVISVGLGYNSDFMTLPLVLERMEALGQGTTKNAGKVYVRVDNSSLLKAGPSFDRLTEYPPRAVSDPYGSPPALRSGMLTFAIAPNWSDDAPVCIRQDQPLPLSILSLVIDAQTGG